MREKSKESLHGVYRTRIWALLRLNFFVQVVIYIFFDNLITYQQICSTLQTHYVSLHVSFRIALCSSIERRSEIGALSHPSLSDVIHIFTKAATIIKFCIGFMSSASVQFNLCKVSFTHYTILIFRNCIIRFSNTIAQNCCYLDSSVNSSLCFSERENVRSLTKMLPSMIFETIEQKTHQKLF